MNKFLVIAVVAIAFLLTLKFAAIMFLWWLRLFFHWGALVIVLVAFCYLAYRHFRS